MTHDYRIDGHDHYQMEYRRESDGTWTIWCHQHPSNPFSSHAHDCHLYASGQVCVSSGNEPRTLERAKAIAGLWMKGYSRYVRTGAFPNDGGCVNV